jgi:hypothetical protein
MYPDNVIRPKTFMRLTLWGYVCPNYVIRLKTFMRLTLWGYVCPNYVDRCILIML